MILKPAPISTRQLSYDASARRFIGEISDTHGFGRVFDDSCDEGLTLVSARTGCEMVFVVNGSERDADGDTTLWQLVPAAELHRRGGYTATITTETP